MLSVAKVPSYLSPSSLMLAEGSPNKFYAERMSPSPLAREPQGPAAACGSSFDAHIKSHLAMKLGNAQTIVDRMHKIDPELQGQPTLLDKLFVSSVEEQHRSALRSVGSQLCDMYKTIPFVLSTEFVDLEMHIFYTILKYGVPLYMKPDASVILNNTIVPFDWKVTGYGSEASPPVGYLSLYDCKTGVTSGPHKDWCSTISMEQIDVKWATQLATYGWGMGQPVGAPFKAVIDCLIHRKSGWRVARYIGTIGTVFQEQLARRYELIWTSLQNGSFVAKLVQEPSLQQWLAMQEKWWMR